MTGPIPSPCRRMCTLDENSQCIGCDRTLDEIMRWTTMTPAEREAVMQRVEDYSPDSRASSARLRSNP